MCQTNFINYQNKKLVHTEQIYMNCQNKFVYMWTILYKRLKQIIYQMEQIFTIVKQILCKWGTNIH
jgi:hypothetical protein